MALGFTLLCTRVAIAQESGVRGTLMGVVRDEQGAAIAGAEVRIAGAPKVLVSDARGTFRHADLSVGSTVIDVRRIGFRPARVVVAVREGATTEAQIALTRIVPTLDVVTVEGRRQRVSGRLAGFYTRSERGNGHFITRDVIDRMRPGRTTDLLRMVPSVRLVSSGLGQWAVQFRGARCLPLVWLDGAPATAGYFDPDFLNPRTIEGIELYAGPATVPIEFMWSGKNAGCGVIVIWSRLDQPPPRRGKRQKQKSATELAALVDSRVLYTADQVDTPAVAIAPREIVPIYPDSLYRAGAGGLVVAEFVVDTTGRVEPETFGIVSSTHPRFSDAVMFAVLAAYYRPATEGGQPVRQIVQQPFRFETVSEKQALAVPPP